MADATIVSELVDVRYLMGITAASKHQSDDGSVFVDVHLEVKNTDTLAGAAGGQKSNSSSTTQTDSRVVPLRLSLPQFYSLLSTLEEAKAALVKATE